MTCLGIDTSNYTTSAAVFDGAGGVNRGKLLQVPPGQLGLRQEIYELFTGRNFCFSKKPNRAEKKAYPQAEGLYQRLAEIAERYRPMVDYMQPEISMGLDGILLK